MKLVADELITTLDQKVTATRDAFITHVRPHILVHNVSTGSIKMSVYDSAGTTLIADGDTLTVSDIMSGTGGEDGLSPSTFDYAHGSVKFGLNFGASESTEYTLRMTATGGYSFAVNNFFGWVRDFDLRKFSKTALGFSSPRLVELWEKKDKLKGV